MAAAETSERRLTVNERLDLARKHGTLGAFMLCCPECEVHWLAAVRWHKEQQRWLLLTAESAFCKPCWLRRALVRVGKKLRRLSEYEGDFRELRGLTAP